MGSTEEGEDYSRTWSQIIWCYWACLYCKKKVKLVTIVEGNPKAPFSIATTPRCRGGHYSFPGLLYFTLDPYLIMLSVKQRGIKYHFLSLWYDSTGPLANTLTARPMSGLYCTPLNNREYFYLCLLLHTVRGSTSFEDLRRFQDGWETPIFLQLLVEGHVSVLRYAGSLFHQ